jgi:hypothetical protein
MPTRDAMRFDWGRSMIHNLAGTPAVDSRKQSRILVSSYQTKRCFPAVLPSECNNSAMCFRSHPLAALNSTPLVRRRRHSNQHKHKPCEWHRDAKTSLLQQACLAASSFVTLSPCFLNILPSECGAFPASFQPPHSCALQCSIALPPSA